jgi:hypothetical protein
LRLSEALSLAATQHPSVKAKQATTNTKTQVDNALALTQPTSTRKTHKCINIYRSTT